MTTFAAEFPINPDRSVNEVICVACRWITGSPHSSFKNSDLDDLPIDEEKSISAENEQVMVAHSTIADGEIGGLRYERSEASLAWTTSIVSLKAGGRHLLRIEVVCEAINLVVRLPPPKKPYFIKQALAELGGGDDGEIPVTDKPFRLTDAEAFAAAKLILGTAGNVLPIIYISTGFDGRHLVNPDELSRFVGGLAHVVVEPSRSFSYLVKKLTRSRNVFGGAIGVYWPESDVRKSYFSEGGPRAGRGLALEIAKDIRVVLSNQRQRSNCSWNILKESVAKNRYEKLKGEGSTELNKYISAFDDDIAAKQQVIAEREQEISRLTAEVRRLTSIEQFAQGGMIKLGDEQDLYEGEIRDIIISALNELVGRGVHSGSRKEHVLRDLLLANIPVGVAQKNSEEIKSLLRDYRSMDAKTRIALSRLGFDLSDDGKHWKAVFGGDPRYTFAIQKTGSDYRGGLNLVSDITKAIF
jgi:hypothetical protein